MIHNCFTKQTVFDYANAGKELVFNQSLAGEWVQLFFSQGLCRCAVPLFFVFSAYLQAKKAYPYSTLLRKRTKSLLLPYLLWSFVYLSYPHFLKLILSVIKPELLNHPNDTILNWGIFDWFHYFLGYGELDIHGDIGLPKFAIQFWFVRDLSILILLYPVLIYAIKRFKIGYFLLITFALFCPVKHLYIIRTQSLFFYSLGLYLAVFDLPLLEKVDSVSWYEAGIFFAVTFVVTWLFYEKLDTSYWFMNIAAAILLLKLGKIIIGNEKLFFSAKYLAPFSFFLYAIHYFLMNLICPLWIKFFPMKNDFFCMFEYFGLSGLIIGLGIGIGILLRKIAPRVFAVLNGGRS